MAEYEEYSTPPNRPPAEGIRIIGAEEAGSVVAGGQQGDGEPGGGRPSAPPLPSPSPSLSFGDDEDIPPPPPWSRPLAPGGAAGLAPAGSASSPGSAPELPHWTDPPTGEVPRILSDSDQSPAVESGEWSGFSRAPRWRNEGDDWDEADFGDASVLADDESRIGALDTSRTEHSDLYSFDDPEPAPPTRIQTRRDPAPPGAEGRVRGRGGPPSARDNTQAVIIGAALGAVFLICAALGPRFVLVYTAAIIVFLTAELFAVLRRAGYKPATLLGLVATIALVFGCYWKGERAVPLILVLVVVFTFIWYLAGVVHARPTVNIAATLLAFGWGGLLGSFAALLLRPVGVAGHSRDGVAFLLAAVLCTVVNDVIAYVAGQAFGVTPMAPSVSPAKTWEGFGVAAVATILTGAGVIGSIHPFNRVDGFILGVAVAVMAPVGDLCESMVKRDIGLKDMGSTLPGHGGLADRFDGLLFVLPTVYYLLQVLHVGVL